MAWINGLRLYAFPDPSESWDRVDRKDARGVQLNDEGTRLRG